VDRGFDGRNGAWVSSLGFEGVKGWAELGRGASLIASALRDSGASSSLLCLFIPAVPRHNFPAAPRLNFPDASTASIDVT